MNYENYIGIDPGKSGAIAVINENGIYHHCTPLIGKEYDIRKALELLLQYEKSFCVLENINYHAAKGRTTAAIMGEGKMLWKALLIALEIPHVLIRPQEWQKEMFSGVPVQHKQKAKRKTKDTKAMALLAQKRLFPKVDVNVTAKGGVSKNAHDGIVDALLMAEFGRRNH